MSSDSPLYVYTIESPAFSNEYLDYPIPDFRAMIQQAIPASVRQEGNGIDFQIGDQTISKPDCFCRSIKAALTIGTKFICYDSAGFHRAALRFVGDNPDYQDVVWRLTDEHALWDIGLLEQRVAWSTEGRAIGFPPLADLRKQS